MRFERPRTWWNKFADAFAGMWVGMRGQSSFAVHFAVAVIVVIAAAALQMSLERWCLLILCIAVVMSAELFNSSLEIIAPAIDEEYNERLRDSLNIASAAVLVAALGASVVGAIIFIARIIELLAPVVQSGS
ncbi:MAG: diacylglycerol kinase [bacterium]|nr:diacylglycerol kinase [bacterium]